MLRPGFFTENLFDDWMDDFEKEFRGIDRKLYGKRAGREMLTDVREHEDHYQVEVDLPGFKKENIQLELKDGYLTITAAKGLDQDTKNTQGKIVRQERYAGTLQRSFYVGEQITPEEIKAKFEDGVLTLEVPKKDQEALPHKTTIMIE
ncbi:MAG: Hsp20/alpha crystallin family protein [Solobacterium sp.]|nr:Hsp20/alpha crystallin family protein [Solobacterium sp.]MBR2668965.1 Hsp20/alpha crystallin family protein [Solobacterium sp.]